MLISNGLLLNSCWTSYFKGKYNSDIGKRNILFWRKNVSYSKFKIEELNARSTYINAFFTTIILNDDEIMIEYSFTYFSNDWSLFKMTRVKNPNDAGTVYQRTSCSPTFALTVSSFIWQYRVPQVPCYNRKICRIIFFMLAF